MLNVLAVPYAVVDAALEITEPVVERGLQILFGLTGLVSRGGGHSRAHNYQAQIFFEGPPTSLSTEDEAREGSFSKHSGLVQASSGPIRVYTASRTEAGTRRSCPAVT